MKLFHIHPNTIFINLIIMSWSKNVISLIFHSKLTIKNDSILNFKSQTKSYYN